MNETKKQQQQKSQLLETMAIKKEMKTTGEER